MEDEIVCSCSSDCISVNNISECRFEIHLKELARVSQQNDSVHIRLVQTVLDISKIQSCSEAWRTQTTEPG